MFLNFLLDHLHKEKAFSTILHFSVLGIHTRISNKVIHLNKIATMACHISAFRAFKKPFWSPRLPNESKRGRKCALSSVCVGQHNANAL